MMQNVSCSWFFYSFKPVHSMLNLTITVIFHLFSFPLFPPLEMFRDPFVAFMPVSRKIDNYVIFQVFFGGVGKWNLKRLESANNIVVTLIGLYLELSRWSRYIFDNVKSSKIYCYFAGRWEIRFNCHRKYLLQVKLNVAYFENVDLWVLRDVIKYRFE